MLLYLWRIYKENGKTFDSFDQSLYLCTTNKQCVMDKRTPYFLYRQKKVPFVRQSIIFFRHIIKYDVFHLLVMQFFDVQITTDLGEVVVIQVAAVDRQEAEMTAISMVESGHAGTMGRCVVDCFAL